jgi:hypothetical protein
MTTPDDPRYWRECAEAMSRVAVIVAEKAQKEGERLRALGNSMPDFMASVQMLEVANATSAPATDIAVLVARLDEITKDPNSLPIDVERALKEYEQS